MTIHKKHVVKKDDWMQSQWRPLMAMMYLAVCSFDFILAPILWSVLQAMDKGNVSSQWMPITLQGAGLFHLAMGAVLGVAAYGRTQEKLSGSSSNQASYTQTTPSPYTPAAPTPTPWSGSTTTSTYVSPSPDVDPNPDPDPTDPPPLRARRQR